MGAVAALGGIPGEGDIQPLPPTEGHWPAKLIELDSNSIHQVQEVQSLFGR